MLVGRDADIRNIEDLLAGNNITITGPVGIGKSAIAAVIGKREPLPTLDCFSIRTPLELFRYVGRTLGVRTSPDVPLVQDAIGQILADRLVVFDNVDGCIEPLRELLGRLHEKSRFRVLITCRNRVEFDDHVIVPIEALSRTEAVALFRKFCERTGSSAVWSDEVLLEELVQTLDCNPLMIELAANRTSQFSVSEIISRAEQRRFLAGPNDGPYQSIEEAILETAANLSERCRSALQTLSVLNAQVSWSSLRNVLGDTFGECVVELIAIGFVQSFDDVRLKPLVFQLVEVDDRVAEKTVEVFCEHLSVLNADYQREDARRGLLALGGCLHSLALRSSREEIVHAYLRETIMSGKSDINLLKKLESSGHANHIKIDLGTAYRIAGEAGAALRVWNSIQDGLKSCAQIEIAHLHLALRDMDAFKRVRSSIETSSEPLIARLELLDLTAVRETLADNSFDETYERFVRIEDVFKRHGDELWRARLVRLFSNWLGEIRWELEALEKVEEAIQLSISTRQSLLEVFARVEKAILLTRLGRWQNAKENLAIAKTKAGKNANGPANSFVNYWGVMTAFVAGDEPVALKHIVRFQQLRDLTAGQVQLVELISRSIAAFGGGVYRREEFDDPYVSLLQEFTCDYFGQEHEEHLFEKHLSILRSDTSESGKIALLAEFARESHFVIPFMAQSLGKVWGDLLRYEFAIRIAKRDDVLTIAHEGRAVRKNGTWTLNTPQAKSTLLGSLAANPDGLTDEEVKNLLWGDETMTATSLANRIKVTVSKLRKTVGVARENGRYRIDQPWIVFGSGGWTQHVPG